VICPLCGSSTRVAETRSVDGGAAIRRRRACDRCGHRLTTYERVVAERLWVRKRSGERQRFDPAKLRASLVRAAHKRPVTGSELDALAAQLESELARAGGELPAARVSELCLEGLADLDRGAYLQYLGTLEPAETTSAAGSAAASAPGGAGSSVRAASEHA
jgi:transcriptional repressor NrdR